MERIYVAGDENLYAYDMFNFKRYKVCAGAHELSITCMTISQQSGVLATSSEDKVIKIWNADLMNLMELRGHSETVTGLGVIEDKVQKENDEGAGKALQLTEENLPKIVSSKLYIMC